MNLKGKKKTSCLRSNTHVMKFLIFAPRNFRYKSNQSKYIREWYLESKNLKLHKTFAVFHF